MGLCRGQYDRLFVGSPIWWHQPAMVVCTFVLSLVLFLTICFPEDMTVLFPSFADVPETCYFRWLNVGRPYFEHLYGFDPYAVIGNYEKDVLILHGDNDGIVPVSYSHRAVVAYPSARLEIFRGAGHGFYDDDFENASKLILEYMSEHLSR